MNRAALISDSEKFKAINKSAGIGYLLVLDDGQVLEANDTALKWFEFTGDIEKKTHINSFIPDEYFSWKDVLNEVHLHGIYKGKISESHICSTSTDLFYSVSVLKHVDDKDVLMIVLKKRDFTNKLKSISGGDGSVMQNLGMVKSRPIDLLDDKRLNKYESIDHENIELLLKQKTIKLNTIALMNSLFIKLPWKEALQHSLESIANTIDADRVYYFENSYSNKGKTTTSLELEWCRSDIEPQLYNPDNQGYTEKDIPELLHCLANNEPYATVLSELTDQKMRMIFESQQIKSLLTIPVIIDHRFWGFIGFDDCRKERIWDTEEVSFLNTITLNLASAIKSEEAKKKLNRTLNEKNRILESIDDGFFTVDRYWIVTYWNRRAEKIFGIPRKDILGKNLWDLFDETVNSNIYNFFHDAILNQKKVEIEEYFAGIEAWLEIVAYPTNDGLSVYFKDINERKLNEQRMNELNLSLKKQTKELAISNAELEQFAFVASHDLQEPLRMITSFLNQIEKKYSELLDDKGKQYIQFATDGAHRMRQIILDLLEFSKIGSMERIRNQVDLNEVMNKILNSYKKLIDEKKTTITWDPLPEIIASDTQMHQLFQNLISNAIKYQKDENQSVVHIAYKELDSHWAFSVEDNGIGIDSEYRHRIFEIFQRLHGNNEYSGTGIGLAICRKIVEEHNGEIWFESELGEGSIFYFTIKKEQ